MPALHASSCFDATEFAQALERHLLNDSIQTKDSATPHQWYLALTRTLSEWATERLVHTESQVQCQGLARVNYLSLEFLIGRLTGNNLMNLGIYEPVRQVLADFGQSLSDLLERERDPALGNGGLGRLAACFLDSLATQGYPNVGYGLHYEYGLFRQSFVDGKQVETADVWREAEGYPWEIQRADLTQQVGFYGKVIESESGKHWQPDVIFSGVPWDLPVLGFENSHAFPLRLWECRVSHFDLEKFNQGQFIEAQQAQIEAGNLTKVLYPNDNHQQGKALRLMQQYFHCACSVADILRRHLDQGRTLSQLPEFEKIQLNDTHPSIAIPELMRLLLDEHQLGWETAWDITSQTFSYTNHTLLPEALETWSEALLGELLPRHLSIIFEINQHFLQQVTQVYPNDTEKLQALSLVTEGGEKQIRMAHLSVVGSHKVNGVAKLHSDLLQRHLFTDFLPVFPERFTNVTNGVTPRRWLCLCNPDLSALISEYLGDGWKTDLAQLSNLQSYAKDSGFQQAFWQIKQKNKQKLADWVLENLNIELDVNAIFDVQIKRLHEYKRQHLNLLHILALYQKLLADPHFDMPPRVFIFAAKAAPGYSIAKDIIWAINVVAERINHDTRIQGKLKVVFLPDYRVSLAELVVPAADLSEQISTAGKEASGTGNMKLALNGALTIGTLDGANVEMVDAVGEDNFFLFGLTVEQVQQQWRQGYVPKTLYESDPQLKAVMDELLSDEWGQADHPALAHIRHQLLDGGDPYLVLADFADYVRAQAAVSIAYQDRAKWCQMAILNVARMGYFSSDRSIEDYVSRIWRLKALS